jgi:hypothetical protein
LPPSGQHGIEVAHPRPEENIIDWVTSHPSTASNLWHPARFCIGISCVQAGSVADSASAWAENQKTANASPSNPINGPASNHCRTALAGTNGNNSKTMPSLPAQDRFPSTPAQRCNPVSDRPLKRLRLATIRG